MSFSVDEVALSVTLFGCTRGDTSFVSKGHSRWRGRDVRNLNDVERHNGPARGSGVEPNGSFSHLARDEITAAKSDGFCNVVVRTLEGSDDRERLLAYRTALKESEAPRSRASDRHAKQDTSSSCFSLRPNAHSSDPSRDRSQWLPKNLMELHDTAWGASKYSNRCRRARGSTGLAAIAPNHSGRLSQHLQHRLQATI